MDLTPPPEPKGDEENIVSFRDGKPLTDSGFPLTMTERPGYCTGWCRRVFVCEKRRMLQCQDCGKMMEAFDYVEEWARKGDARLSALRELAVQIKTREAELARLKMDITNAKAQLKRARENSFVS